MTTLSPAQARKKQAVLLPSGFRDLLPQEAYKEDQAVRAFMDTCHGYGYERVRPPLAEFEEALFAEGPGAFVKEQAFRFVDPVSQKMMALRFDITTQIARIASTRFSQRTQPLRLMYANDVLRAKATQHRIDRQFRQLGCEIVSPPDIHADIEIAVLSVQALRAMGVKDITLDVAYTRLLHLILESYAIEGDDKEQWLDMLARKDMAALNARPEAFSQGLAEAVSACGDTDATLMALERLDLNTEAKTCIAELRAVTAGVQSALSDHRAWGDVRVTLDPFELRGFQYHSGVCFTLFTAHVGTEIGRGGRYDIQGGLSATGFTVYMDMLLDHLPLPSEERRVHVPADLSWTEIKALQDEGWIVIRVLPYENRDQITGHVYHNGEIIVQA